MAHTILNKSYQPLIRGERRSSKGLRIQVITGNASRQAGSSERLTVNALNMQKLARSDVVPRDSTKLRELLMAAKEKTVVMKNPSIARSFQNGRAGSIRVVANEEKGSEVQATGVSRRTIKTTSLLNYTVTSPKRLHLPIIGQEGLMTPQNEKFIMSSPSHGMLTPNHGATAATVMYDSKEDSQMSKSNVNSMCWSDVTRQKTNDTTHIR